MPKVLLLGGALIGGGAETRLRLIAGRLFDGTADLAVLKNDHPIALGPTQQLVDLSWSGVASYPTMCRRLRRTIKARGYDAVLSFGYNANLLSVAATRGLRGRPAVIVTENTRPQTSHALYSGSTRRAIVTTVNRLVYRMADRCAANSKDGMAEIVRHYGADRDRVRRVPNLVEPERLAALAAAGGPVERAEPPSLCVVARLQPLKRIDTLLQAAAALAALDWRIDLVGDGPERPRLETLADGLGIRGRVHFYGWQHNPYPVMARATALVLCSTLEGFSNAVLEAMALRVPVITSFCSSDAVEMCQRGVALGFAVGDVAALKDRIDRVLRDERLRRDLSANAWRYAQDHTVARAVPVYEALVYDAIDGIRRRQSPLSLEASRSPPDFVAR